MIPESDKSILRTLGERVAEVAAQPVQQERREAWRRSNDLLPSRPMIFCDPENSWEEILPKAGLLCASDLGRNWERTLRKQLFWGEEMGDDRVIEPFFEISDVSADSGWGLKHTQIQTQIGGSYTWDAPLKDYEMDFPRLHFPRITIDKEASVREMALAREIFGNILDVHRKNYWWWSFGLTYPFALLRGMEQMMLDMYDNPDELHRVMAFLRDGTLALMDQLEAEDLLSQNHLSEFIGSHSHGYTSGLPQPDFTGHVRTMDMWGFAESQETVSVSPAMFEEFVFQYQLPLLERFGMNYYGCCEPLDKRWHIVKRVPRLRKVSVSPWCSVEDMVEKLEDKYVLSIKFDPSYLAWPTIDEDFIRKDLRRKLDVTRGCHVEIILKDTHTISKNPENVKRWCAIAREEIGRT